MPAAAYENHGHGSRGSKEAIHARSRLVRLDAGSGSDNIANVCTRHCGGFFLCSLDNRNAKQTGPVVQQMREPPGVEAFDCAARILS